MKQCKHCYVSILPSPDVSPRESCHKLLQVKYVTCHCHCHCHFVMPDRQLQKIVHPSSKLTNVLKESTLDAVKYLLIRHLLIRHLLIKHLLIRHQFFGCCQILVNSYQTPIHIQEPLGAAARILFNYFHFHWTLMNFPGLA